MDHADTNMEKIEQLKAEIANRLCAFGERDVQNINNKLNALIVAVYENSIDKCSKIPKAALILTEERNKIVNSPAAMEWKAALAASIEKIMDEE